MSKSTDFIGQPILNQLLFFIQGANISKISKRHGGERYIKKFDTRKHLFVMPFGVIEGYCSIRKLVIGMLSNAHRIIWFAAVRYPMPMNEAACPRNKKGKAG